MTDIELKELKKLCYKNIDKDCRTYFYDENKEVLEKEKLWSILALFLRQWLNNGNNGFGMKNVKRIGNIIYDNLNWLIENNYIEKTGFNNFGFKLW